MKTTSAELKPVLALLRSTLPGALYIHVDKKHLLAAALECLRTPITAAQWNKDGTTLTIEVDGHHKISLTVNGGRLVTECGCPIWTSGRQCHHVAAVWMILKRIVSPETLSHIRFNERHLLKTAALLGVKAFPGSPPPPKDRIPPLSPVEEKTSEPRNFRLLLEEINGKIYGSVRSGNQPVYHWTAAPVELKRFLARNSFFEPSVRYFREYTLTGGDLPIVLRTGGREIALKLVDGTNLQATVVFNLLADTVTISRCFDGGVPIPAGAIITGDCLIDPAAGSIRPITRIETWQMWKEVEKRVLAVAEAGYEDVRRERNGFSVSKALFNKAALRIHPDRFAGVDYSSLFLADGIPDVRTVAAAPDYFLDICSDLEGETIRLAPVVDAGGIRFPFAGEMFWWLDPGRRSALSVQLRTKKRLKTILETAFSTMAATSATARAAVIRGALIPPDYIKRAVKADAKRLITNFVQQSGEKVMLLHAGDNGWLFAADERKVQARLIEIIYRMFGMESFAGSDFPGGIELSRQELLPRLGELAAALREAGCGLRYRGEPLTAGTWDFVVEASRHAIDWFELSPEIRCNGELLAAEEIQAVLEGGVLRQGETCYLLDEEQRRILQLLFGGRPGKGKKKRIPEPVRIPRLQILDWLELRARGVTLRLPPEDEQLLANLTRLERIPARSLPAGIRTTLRHYQHEGYEWLAFLYEHRFGACLADDMGLGKTVQAIAFLAGLAEGEISTDTAAGPHLIVVPPSLLFNWESEIARFYPDFRLITYAGQRRTADFTGADIVLTSYGTLQRDIDCLEKLDFNVIIFDEAQQVKNIQAATTGAARRVRGRFKLTLTGTPMENHLGEYYAIMDLCMPGLLGPYQEFRRRFDIREIGGIDTLIRRTRPFILRRSKQMIADELPPRIEIDLYLELTTRQRALYQQTVQEVRAAVDEAFRAKAAGQARMIALTAILRLRQICLSASLLNPGSKGDSPKQECLADQLLELRDEGHSALVFSQFTSYLDLVEEGLQHRGLATIRLDGSTPVPRRKELVRSFQESTEPMVFLISLKAGGKGLNLTRATYVYHLDPWWNPAVENQASDRAHRIGQTAQVTVNRLLMRHTIEEKMMALKERKLRLYRALLDDAADAAGVSLSKEDFDFLLS